MCSAFLPVILGTELILSSQCTYRLIHNSIWNMLPLPQKSVKNTVAYCQNEGMLKLRLKENLEEKQ